MTLPSADRTPTLSPKPPLPWQLSAPVTAATWKVTVAAPQRRPTGPGPSPGPRSGTPCSPPAHQPPPDTRPSPNPARPGALNSGKAGQTSSPNLPNTHTMINFAAATPSTKRNQADPRIQV